MALIHISGIAPWPARVSPIISDMISPADTALVEKMFAIRGEAFIIWL
jgi:hypothetical protein